MESNERYYRRRAIQELAAARHAVTEAAMQRRRAMAETYLRRLAELTGVDEMHMLQGVEPAYA
jgi:AraC-like DNA-binding protein